MTTDLICVDPRSSAAALSVASSDSQALHQVPVTAILPSRWQPRTTWDPEALLELAKHIRDHGLMYPVLLFPVGSPLPPGRGVGGEGESTFELIAGERRTRAIVALALPDIPAWSSAHDRSLHTAVEYVAAQGWLLLEQDPALWDALSRTTILARLEDPADLPRLHQLAVADNIQRQNLSPIEEAVAIHDLMEANGLTQSAVGEQLGWSQQKVADRLSLLKLAPEVRREVTARAVSPSHARAISRLPVDVQPAFTVVAKAMIDRQGDQAATVNQVASLAQAVKRFLDPDHWLPAPEDVLLPTIRNRMRLMRHLLTRLQQSGRLAERAPAILALASHARYGSTENLLAHKPETICRDYSTMGEVLRAVIGKENSGFDSAWDAAAVENVWRCTTCRLNTNAPLADLDVHLPCPRWHGGRPVTPINTCDAWTSAHDPLVLLAESSMASWSHKLVLRGYHSDPFPYFDDLDAWIAAARLVTDKVRAQDRERRHDRDTRHIRELEAYFAQQSERLSLPGPFAEDATHPPHFQAHLCYRCVHHRPDHHDLPRCHFAVEPLEDYGGPKAPDFGLLVRQDGLMLPRCSRFRLAECDGSIAGSIEPMRGFLLPDRPAVLAWIRRLAAWPSRNDHDSTLFAGLAWLPYDRPKPKDSHDLDGLVRYLARAWDQLGDERIATLLHILVSEIGAMANFHNGFELFNPLTLIAERWASAPWSVLSGGGPSWRVYDYPTDWPRPWESSRQGEDSPPPVGEGLGERSDAPQEVLYDHP